MLRCSMKQLLRFVTLGFFTGCFALHAQNFSGSDTFSSDSGNWTNGATANGGAFSVSGDVLNFTDLGLGTSQSSSALRTWSLNAGSSVADWQVQIDLTLNLTPVIGQIDYWNLLLTNSGDAATTTDYFQVEYVRSYMPPPDGHRFVRGTLWTDGEIGTSNQTDLTSATVAVRASYLASTQTLTLAYDADGGAAGYVFTDLYSSSLAAWAMGAGDGFVLSLSFTNSANADATIALTSGQVFADNFIATPAAIPEPSTYAAGFGLLALLVVGLKRRFGQQ